MNLKNIPPPIIFAIIISLISIIITAVGGSLALPLQYDRDQIGNGEVWRIVTGHFVHLGWPHLGLNLSGIALIFFFFWRALSLQQWLILFMISSLFTGVMIYQFNPDIRWYVGLSGILHGLFLAGSGANFRYHPIESTALSIIIVGKLIWEQFYGPLPGSEESAGGPVLVDAHFYGGLGGLAYLSVYLVVKRMRSHPLSN